MGCGGGGGGVLAGAPGVAFGVPGADAALPGAGLVAGAGWLAAVCSAFCGGWFLLQPATRSRPARGKGRVICVSLAGISASTRMPQPPLNWEPLSTNAAAYQSPLSARRTPIIAGFVLRQRRPGRSLG